jgi:hypothetical protein
MRRRLSPEGLDMRDGTPENRVFRVILFAGLPVPAPPFAQRDSFVAQADVAAKDRQRGGLALEAAQGDPFHGVIARRWRRLASEGIEVLSGQLIAARSGLRCTWGVRSLC